MKRTVLVILLGILCSQSDATRPFSPQVFVDDDSVYAVGFPWPDQNDDVLLIRSMRKTYTFSLDDLGIRRAGEMSTAGYRWYRNSIGFVFTVKLKEETSRARVFCFRHRSGHVVLIDVNSGAHIELSSMPDKNSLNREAIRAAAALLKSDQPRDRQTAAIHLGQLNAGQYLRELKKLLGDEAFTTWSTKTESRKVYYVKEAAQQAIELIGQGNESE